jgi:hypothetical protein
VIEDEARYLVATATSPGWTRPCSRTSTPAASSPPSRAPPSAPMVSSALALSRARRLPPRRALLCGVRGVGVRGLRERRGSGVWTEGGRARWVAVRLPDREVERDGRVVKGIWSEEWDDMNVLVMWRNWRTGVQIETSYCFAQCSDHQQLDCPGPLVQGELLFPLLPLLPLPAMQPSSDRYLERSSNEEMQREGGRLLGAETPLL